MYSRGTVWPGQAEAPSNSSGGTTPIRNIAIAAIILGSSLARANDSECEKKIGPNSVCEVAAKLAKEMASRLPMKANDQVSLDSAHSNMHTVTVAGTLNFDRETARSFLDKNKITLAQFESSYSAKTRPSLCKPGSMTEEFIRSGGIVSYTYAYRDGTPFMSFSVKSCD